MAWSGVRLCAWLEISVVLFQVFGVTGLCLNRLLPTTRWAERGRVGFVAAMIGLGLAGAVCGRLDSEFALFAGGTMTFLLIAMSMGTGSNPMTVTTRGRVANEPTLAG